MHVLKTEEMLKGFLVDVLETEEHVKHFGGRFKECACARNWGNVLETGEMLKGFLGCARNPGNVKHFGGRFKECPNFTFPGNIGIYPTFPGNL